MNARASATIFAVPDLCFATLPSGQRMPYVTTGAGEPLLFVHGSLCDYRYWNAQTAALSQQFTCVSVSLSHYWPVEGAGAGTHPPPSSPERTRTGFSWRASLIPARTTATPSATPTATARLFPEAK